MVIAKISFTADGSINNTHLNFIRRKLFCFVVKYFAFPSIDVNSSGRNRDLNFLLTQSVRAIFHSMEAWFIEVKVYVATEDFWLLS